VFSTRPAERTDSLFEQLKPHRLEAGVNMQTGVNAVARQGEEQIENLLGHEYEHEPVPMRARRSAFSVTMVWLGFPMIITGAMTGSLLVLGMGFKSALAAMIIGNIIMFAYVGALGLLGTKRGMNFALIASIVFGKNGYVLASGLLSTLLLGWYAVQTGITGALVSSTFGLNYVAMTVIAGCSTSPSRSSASGGCTGSDWPRCRCSSFSAFGLHSTRLPRRRPPPSSTTQAITALRPCPWASV
jgi:hypothetical protein